ncbi:HesB/IscA family protein [Sneathiella glossodoripedis]|uniref:HesB/IscA family protein n=1 Tax=Sneathiella glossodoripedis TaxID=418853 RepID=UPI0004714325|nr:iron-sulfur cluster assembly accessory protein [Sneathiella glossodoripedis]
MSDMQILTLTDKAENRLKSLIAQNGTDVIGLRIGITNTGCNGLSYTMDFAKETKADDIIVDTGDVKLLIDNDAVQYVSGTQMDWQEKGLESKFTFENPNEKGRCGCGSSFHV